MIALEGMNGITEFAAMILNIGIFNLPNAAMQNDMEDPHVSLLYIFVLPFFHLYLLP